MAREGARQHERHTVGCIVTGPWLVRLGSKRGAGEYVHPAAFVLSDGDIGASTTTPHQRKARRFTWRDLADVYARAFGGRVVRLRERGRQKLLDTFRAGFGEFKTEPGEPGFEELQQLRERGR